MLALLMLKGTVGPMYIGQPKKEFLEVLGPPSMWDGKPGTILDKGIHDYERSKSWIYNGIYVSFCQDVIDEFSIWLEYPFIDLDHEWFSGWNLPRVPKLSQVMEYLDLHHVPYAVTDTKPGQFGCSLVLPKGYVFGTPQRNPKVEEIDVYGITRRSNSTSKEK